MDRLLYVYKGEKSKELLDIIFYSELNSFCTGYCHGANLAHYYIQVKNDKGIVVQFGKRVMYFNYIRKP